MSCATYSVTPHMRINVFQNIILIIMHEKTDDWIFNITTNINKPYKRTSSASDSTLAVLFICTLLSLNLPDNSNIQKQPVWSPLLLVSHFGVTVTFSSLERYKTSNMT